MSELKTAFSVMYDHLVRQIQKKLETKEEHKE